MSVFWYHYNKPASKKAGKPQLTVHYEGQCIIVDYIHCNVPTYTYNRNSQPHCVIKGRGRVDVSNGVALINKESKIWD